MRFAAASFAIVSFLSIGFGPDVLAQSSALITGEVQRITLDPSCADVWCGGTMTVGGQDVVIPRNLVIDFPANRLTLRQLIEQAPAACAAAGESGLARMDQCLSSPRGAIATIEGNRSACGDVVAGHVFLAKGTEFIQGVVTFVNHTDGYFRVNGTASADAGGYMVRLNDPTGRHSIQQGLGCGTTPNCSADARFTNDPDNYTLTFTTGYPLCIPSTVTGVGSRTVGANAVGVGDPFCPATNRGGATVADSRRFAPVQVGDHLTLTGNMETVNGVTFLSPHTVMVGAKLTTREEANQPDYLIFAESGWDVAAYQNQRARARFIGFSTLPTSRLDIFALRVDPQDGSQHEQPLASTVNNPQTVNQGVAPTADSIWRIFYDVDFITGPKTGRDPCANLAAAGIPVCTTGGTAEAFSILAPPSRDVIAHTRRVVPVSPGVFAQDLRGIVAPSSQYLTPVANFEFPTPAEINLASFAQPLSFDGMPWLMDRRISPGGCDGQCESTAQPLDPFPIANFDPRTQAQVPPSTANRILTFFTTINGVLTPQLLSWPPIDRCGATPNAPPTAVNDTATTPAGTALAIDVLANDTDPNGNLLASTVAIVTPPIAAAGTAVAQPSGSVLFTPVSGFSGVATFTYTVADSKGAVSNAATVSVTVQPPPAPAAALSVATLGFAGRDPGTTSLPATVTLSNTGAAPLVISTVALTGIDASQFGIVTDGCGARTVAPASSCAVSVRFAPTHGGSVSARLAFTDNAPGSPHQVLLTGVGFAPAVALAPASLGFGTLAVGATSTTLTARVTNSGTGTLHVGGATLTGTNASDFGIVSNGCGTVAAGASCAIGVRFAPASGGAKTASLSITSDGPGSPHAVTLTGTCSAPAVAFAPSALSFGTTIVGVPTAARTVTLTNTGNAALAMRSVLIDGAYPGDYQMLVNGCPALLAPSRSCTVSLRFLPRVSGLRPAQLSVASNAAGSPHHVPLAGTGRGTLALP